MTRKERYALWGVSILPTVLMLCVGLPWALGVRSALAEVSESVQRQKDIDGRLVLIYERVRTVQVLIEKQFGVPPQEGDPNAGR